MYNEIVKNEFLDYILNTTLKNDLKKDQENWIVFLKAVSVAEEMYDVDIYNADYEITKAMLAMILTNSFAYKTKLFSNLHIYIGWCIVKQKSISQRNLLDTITLDDIDFSRSTVNTMIKNEAELLNFLNISFNKESDDTIDNLYRIYSLLLFSGFKLKETLLIEKCEVDFENANIRSGNKEINISQTTLKYIKNFMELEGYKNGKNYRNKADTKYLLDFSVSNRRNVASYCQAALSKANAEYKKITGEEIQLNATNILKSGIFSRIYENEKKLNSIDYSEFIVNFTSSKKVSDKQKDFISKGAKFEYKIWKKAFLLD